MNAAASRVQFCSFIPPLQPEFGSHSHTEAHSFFKKYCFFGATLYAGILATFSTCPEPAKGACGQESIDQAIQNFLDCHAQRLTLPDSVTGFPMTSGTKSLE